MVWEAVPSINHPIRFRFSENLMHEKKFANVAFDESLEWPVYNYLLCNTV